MSQDVHQNPVSDDQKGCAEPGVQYCEEFSAETRWVDNKPGKDWVINFQRRWHHQIKLRRPRAIK